MVFNFKKITSVLTSAIMIGSTIGIAAAANYPAPFVQSGKHNVAIIVGSSAASSDYLAALDVGQNLQLKLAEQTAVSGAGGGASTSGGDAVNLATGSQQLYYNSSVGAARTALSKNELPTLLADGSIIDDSGTTYTYTQTVTLGSRLIQYSTSGADFSDPALIVEVGTTASNYLYQYKLGMNKVINASHADVQGNEIEILGTKYTIGSGTDLGASPAKLVLFGAGEVVTLNEGESSTVNIGGTEHTVEVQAITQTSSTDKVSVSVDGGAAKEISEGSSSKIGGIDIYAKTVVYSAKESTTNYATLNLGSSKITLQEGSAVLTGSEDDTITGTKVTLTETGDKLSTIQVNVSLQSSSKDYIPIGGSFLDPVFGNLKVEFAGVNPALDSDAREAIKIDTNGDLRARVLITPFKSGNPDNSALTYAFDIDSSTTTTTPRPLFESSGNKNITLVENETMEDVGDLILINSEDNGRIVEISEMPDGTLTSNSKVTLKDWFTKAIVAGPVTVGTTGQATVTIDGVLYYITVPGGTSVGAGDNSSIRINWGDGSGYDNPGTATTLFPRIKLKNGGWFTILYETRLKNATKYALPGVEDIATYQVPTISMGGASGALVLTNGPNGTLTTIKYGNINYTIELIENTTMTGKIRSISTGASADCIFNSSQGYGPAILFIEEKKVVESGNANNGDAICIPGSTFGTAPADLAIGDPVATNIWSTIQSWTSDQYKKTAVTRYGTYIEQNTQDNKWVKIYYPDNQMYADVLFAESGATIVAGTSGGGRVDELGTVAVMDSEVNSVSSKNLIVVGGSCVNSVAARLLGSTGALCGSAFTAKTGVGPGQFLVETFASPVNADRIATLVAGFEAGDTKQAVKYVTDPTKTVMTDKGQAYKKTSSTFADVSVA
ncbi:hypothetical protein HYV49_04740 [Candidatus Pacearchaeota archaeon]|nr:hypothetical protein [Candidatus Pacearchaeota archaeon]